MVNVKNNEEQVDISQDMKSKGQPSQDNRDPHIPLNFFMINGVAYVAAYTSFQ
jgi:hypothetical protein